tara:strand:+ start:280 stop:2751 length:2472 start_codon:yes stop_codon:yes gene_type:complete
MTTSFQSFSQGGQFQSARVDLGSNELEQLNQRRERELQQQSAELLRRDTQAAKEIAAGAQGLAQFSDSLSSILIERQKKENEKQMLEGMREYWFNGATEEERAQFKADEAALGEARSAADQAASEYELGGGDTFVAQSLRELSGWKAYGFAKAMLQQAGVSYGSHYTARGQELGLNETSDPRERAAIEQQIREEYMTQYQELNPMLLHEHLFPSMRKFEQGEQLAYANRQAKLFQKQRETERTQTLYATFVNADPTEIATNLMGWVDQYKGQFGGSSALAFAEATELIRTGLGNGSIDPTAFREALDAQVTLRDGSTKQLRVARAKDFALLEQAAISAQTQKLNRSIEELSNTDKQAILERVNRWKESDRSQKAYNEIFGDLRLFDDSNYGLLSGIQTNEEFDDRMTIEEIEQRLDAGVPVSQALVDRINDSGTRADYQQKVLEDDKLHPPEALLDAAQTELEAAVKDETQVFEYDSLHNIYGKQNALAYYRQQYQIYRQDDPPDSPRIAHDKAMKDALAQIPEQFKLKEGGFFQRPEFKYQTDNIKMYQDVNRRVEAGTISFDTKIEGLDDQVKQLNDSIKARTGITTFWRELADQHGVDVYKLINTNLRGYGFDEFNPLPKTVAELDSLSAESRRQLQFHKTPARELRAATSSAEANWFLDSIASVESRSYGGYEAFNRGGTDGGHTAIGSGNSTTDLDKPITSMTLGEIKQRHAEGSLHAVGRYQFIGTTFLETANLLGFDDNQKFDEKTQDLFALTRAAVRVQAMNGGSVAGLSAEWIGLNNLPPAQLQRMVAIARGLPHYRQVHTLLPGVAAATLKPN